MNTAVFETIQRDSIISFPFLGLELNPPSYFTVFGKEIYFYGVIIAVGFLLGILFCAKNAKKFGLTEDNVYDVIIWLIPMSIIGARAYFVLFRLEDYISHPIEIFAVRAGGLAIYGGVIAGVITAYIVSRRKKFSFAAMLDLLIFGLLIGQIMGRWGNFINREAFGGETDIFCRMGLTAPDGTTIYVHPTFLYESLWNLGCFIFLYLFVKKGRRRYDGQVILIYFLVYGIGRAWIEGLRTDSLYIGSTGIRVSQALSILLALAAGIVLLVQSKRPHPPEKLFVNRVRAEAESSAKPAGSAENSSAGNSSAEDGSVKKQQHEDSSAESK